MTTETMEDRIVQVDATVALGEYFHAYVDAVKIRLIVACLIVAAVSVGFSYFFILIGEQTILLQLSPLFFGIPIMAIVGQLLRMHASYRKYLRDLSESEKEVHYIFREQSDGFDIVRGNNFAHVAWESVRRVIERPRYFRFVLGGPEALIVPKTLMKDSADQELLRQIIVSQVGNRARMLNS